MTHHPHQDSVVVVAVLSLLMLLLAHVPDFSCKRHNRKTLVAWKLELRFPIQRSSIKLMGSTFRAQFQPAAVLGTETAAGTAVSPLNFRLSNWPGATNPRHLVAT